VAFLDADDLWAPQKMHRQLEFLAANPDCVGCHTGVRVIDARECEIAVYADKPARLEMRHLLTGNQVLTSSFVIERRALIGAGGFDARYRTSQDFELVLRLVRQGASLGFLGETLATLRRAGHGNISSRGALLLRNHARIARDYKADLIEAGGYRAYLGFVAKYLYEDGARMNGFGGLLCRGAGRLLPLLVSRG
jgi:teichuronic acid biosynthesis glycosyltransferase TuaG